jgi:uncharacterized membrane protein
MVTTGYSDTFNRTVSNGLGSASSGQTYTLFGTATQFSVAPSVASIAISSAGDKLGYVDLQTQNVDITAQVALSAIPATNLATVGFVSKLATISNYYNATMMVASTGAVSLRFSKVIGGGLTTISTTLVTGLTYVANTFYNLRYQIYWSQALQTNVMSLKLWAIGATQPGGWMATATDAAITNYTAGTQVGIMGRDESSVVGSVTTKHQSLAVFSYALPMPALTDPMCYDPAVTYPKQTALQSLAAAADTAVAAIDPLTSLAGLFPRVRVSNSAVTINTAGIFINATFNTTEFNVNTPTNLGYDNTGIYLPVGIWLVTFEIQLAEAASDYILLNFGALDVAAGSVYADMRSNAVQTNDAGVGGCGHISKLAISTDPTTPMKYFVTLSPNNVATTYTATYMALSAIKISDYFA